MFKTSPNKLQYIAAIRVAERLINEAFPKNYGKRPAALLSEKTWIKLRKSITRALQTLPLPPFLKTRLLRTVDFLYHQTCQWINQMLFNNDCEVLFLQAYKLNELFFQSYGQVDQKQVLEARFESMIREYIKNCDNLSCLFISACNLCLEDKVYLMWSNMTEEDHYRMLARNTKGSFLSYWLYQVVPSDHNERICKSAEWYKLELSVETNFFLHAAEDCRLPALEYMWNLLSEDEKKYRSYRCAEVAVRNKMANLAIIALNYLSQKDFEQIIHQNAKDVLMTFLDGPHDEFFIQVVEMLWSHVSSSLYCDLFRRLVEKIPVDMKRDDKNKTRFENFWEKSPSSSKLYAMSDHITFRILNNQLDLLEAVMSPRNFKEVIELLNQRVPT